MSTGVVAPSSPTTAASPPEPATGEVVSSSSSLAPATVPAPPPPSDSFVGGDFLFEDILSLQHKRNGRLLSFLFCLFAFSFFFFSCVGVCSIGMYIYRGGRAREDCRRWKSSYILYVLDGTARFFLRIVKRSSKMSQNSFTLR